MQSHEYAILGGRKYFSTENKCSLDPTSPQGTVTFLFLPFKSDILTVKHMVGIPQLGSLKWKHFLLPTSLCTCNQQVQIQTVDISDTKHKVLQSWPPTVISEEILFSPFVSKVLLYLSDSSK